MQKFRRLLVGLIATAAIFAVSAAPASALNWVSEGFTGLSGTLTYTKEGGKTPVECPLSNVDLLNPSGLDVEKGFIWGGWKPKCSSGVTAEIYPYFAFVGEISPGKFQFDYYDSFWEGHTSPWSPFSWWENEFEPGTVTFINESGSEKSRFVFNKTTAAYTVGPSFAQATGTLSANGKLRIE